MPHEVNKGNYIIQLHLSLCVSSYNKYLKLKPFLWIKFIGVVQIFFLMGIRDNKYCDVIQGVPLFWCPPK